MTIAVMLFRMQDKIWYCSYFETHWNARDFEPFWHVYVLWLGVYWWNVTSECPTTWRQTVTRRDVRPSHDVTSDRYTKEKIR